MLIIRRLLALILAIVGLLGFNFSAAPVLTGCFKNDDARAYVFVNMFSPDNGKSAKISVKFDDAENITVYRKGNVIRTEGNTLKLTLGNNEGIFVTVE